MIRFPVYPVFIPQAGCPHRCLYCNQSVATAAREVPVPEAVRERLDAWLPAAGRGEIAFYGGSFTLLPGTLQRAYLELAADFVSRGRAGGIRFSTRPDGLEDAHLGRLTGYPVTTVEVGCQSFSAAVLAASRRGYDPVAMLAGLARLRAVGSWRVGLQLMPGLPGADPNEGLESLREALRLAPDFLRIYPTLVLTGTALERRYRAGSYRPMSLAGAVSLAARMLAAASLAEVPVERLGLPGESGWHHGGSGLCAGPYHPAFGQLVRAEQWRRVLGQLLSGCEGSVLVRVPGRCLSDALGHRRSNLARLSSTGRLRIEGARHLAGSRFMIDDKIFNWREQLRLAYGDDSDGTTAS